jgi:hypothetical protein
MPILSGRKKQWAPLAVPVSYRLNETRNRLFDAKNVYPNQGRLSTRFGVRRYNSTSLAGAVLSTSFFKTTADTRYLLGKVGTVLYSVAASGAHTSVKTGLTSTTKHRGVTFNNRHIIAVENDGLFQWDGTTFTGLGQAPPAAPTLAAQGSGLTDSTYIVVYTFYSSTTGFESNQSADSAPIATTTDGIRVTMATTATNATIDYKRVYLKDVTGDSDYLFVAEVALATATYDVAANPTSAVTPPTKHAPPISGGGKFVVKFGTRLAYAGNSTFKNDVFISEENLPDAFDNTSTEKTFACPSDGPITGLACGLYDESVQDPYLVVFKRSSTNIYSEIGGVVRLVELNDRIGCVNHETISIKNGDVYFLSRDGWRVISNGKLIKDQSSQALTLGGGDIDDIFKSPGYVYELNQSQYYNFHSIYYSKHDQYINFVAEGSNTGLLKAYVYAFEAQGFFPWDFQQSLTCSCNGEDSSANETIFLGDSTGYFFTYSEENAKTDNTAAAVDANIQALALMAWYQGDTDMAKSFNFIDLYLRALANSNNINCYTWLDFALTTQVNYTYSLPSPSSGFILDVSELDSGVFSDGREIVMAHNMIKRNGKNILIGFYQEAADSSMELISAQLEWIANGNTN